MTPTIFDNTEFPELRTEPFLHLDCNPINGTIDVGGFHKTKTTDIDLENELVVQGLLALTDATEEDGGFHCVPCSHLFAKSWVNLTGMQNVPKYDPLWNHIVRVPLRAGSLLIWNNLLFHGNFPNYSHQWRMVQYLRMLPQKNSWALPRFPKLEYYPPGFLLSSPKVFGIEEEEG
jgi:ectoine hydroxylase-related dioxygenase (phytanoyl-CoA dioxygenase family)